MNKKRLLLTGGGGFVGSHVLLYFLKNTNYEIIVIDSFRHKGTYSRLDQVFNEVSQHKNRVKIYNHDLSVPIDNVLENKLLEKELNGEYKPINYILNIASNSAVERSITDPVSCLRNNFEIGLNILEFSRRIKDKGLEISLLFSTDECFGDASGLLKGHNEWDSMLPSCPYAASKVCQEAMYISYWRSYNLPIVITSCMNIIGKWQDTEKFLPKLVWKLATKQKMEIYADDSGQIGSRMYIHGKTVGSALDFILKRKSNIYPETDRPDKYNIVGDKELNNLEVAEIVANHLGLPLDYKITLSKSIRPGYDKRYALDGSKLLNLGWKSNISSVESIKEVAEWTYQNPFWII